MSSVARRCHGLLAALALSSQALPARAESTQEPAPASAMPAPTVASPLDAAPPAAAVTPPAAPVPTAMTEAPRAPTVAAAAPTQASAGPECERPDEPSEGAGMFFLGLGLFDFSDLNHHLRAHGYEPVDSPVTLIGGEGHAILPSGFVIGARGGALLTPDGTGPDGLRRSFGGGFGMADLGYAFLRREALLVTLTTGIGGYGLELGLGDGQSVSFDEVLQNPRRSSSLSRGGVLVGLTLGVDGRISVGPAKDGSHGFFTLGARVGALYGPALGSWSLSEGGDAVGGPGPGLAGGFAALALGFGGGREPPPAGSK